MSIAITSAKELGLQMFRWTGFISSTFFLVAIIGMITFTDVQWPTVRAHIGFMFKLEYTNHLMFWAFWLSLVQYPARLIFDTKKSLLPWRCQADRAKPIYQVDSAAQV